MNLRSSKFVLILILFLVIEGFAIPLDIHLKLDSKTEAYTFTLDQYIHDKDENDDIYLQTKDTPHATLYLTDWRPESVEILQTRLSKLIPSHLNACSVHLNDTWVQGSYGMWRVLVDDCLQEMSDVVVNATFDLIVPNQPIPPWVQKLPEPERSEKIHYIKLYGSPNVFSQFQPHVTLAFDAETPDKLADIFAHGLPCTPHSFETRVIGLGTTGPHGTVLRGQDKGQWDISESVTES